MRESFILGGSCAPLRPGIRWLLSMNETVIVEYLPQYGRELVQMWQDSFAHAVGIRDPHSFEDQLHFVEQELVRSNSVVIVLQKGAGKVVGFSLRHPIRFHSSMFMWTIKAKALGRCWSTWRKRVQMGVCAFSHSSVTRMPSASTGWNGRRCVGDGRSCSQAVWGARRISRARGFDSRVHCVWQDSFVQTIAVEARHITMKMVMASSRELRRSSALLAFSREYRNG